jgi:uncharacterized protein (TIGR02996 family)
MTPADGFVKAIIEEPDDDALRLIYADWLEERGDPRGAFIRAQCRLATLEPDAPERTTLEEEESDLLKRHQDEWAAPFRGVVNEWAFVRGFVGRVDLTADALLAHGDALFRDHPVRHVRLWGPANLAGAVSDCPLLARVETLDPRGFLGGTPSFLTLLTSPHLDRLRCLVAVGVDASAFDALFQSPRMAQLHTLDLHDNYAVGDRVLRALASTPAAAGLRALRLRRANCTWRGLQDLLTSRRLTSLSTLEVPVSNLFQSGGDASAVFAHPRARPTLGRLTSLDLNHTGFGSRALPALVARLRDIRHLNLSGCHLDNATGRVLGEAPQLAGLRRLHLDFNALRDTGVKALAASPHLTGLTALTLCQNGIGGPGVQALADAPNLAGLTVLDLTENYVGLGSVKALAESPYLSRLTRLLLASNHLEPEAVRLLTASDTLTRLTALHLGANPLGYHGVRLLADAPSLGRLRTLGLSATQFGDAGADALIASPHLRRLQRLEVNGNLGLSGDARARLRDRFGEALVP